MYDPGMSVLRVAKDQLRNCNYLSLYRVDLLKEYNTGTFEQGRNPPMSTQIFFSSFQDENST